MSSLSVRAVLADWSKVTFAHQGLCWLPEPCLGNPGRTDSVQIRFQLGKRQLSGCIWWQMIPEKVQKQKLFKPRSCAERKYCEYSGEKKHPSSV